MRPIEGDMKAIVERGYDAASDAYTAARVRELPYLDLLTGRLEPGARVLDIGCGAGVPVAAALAAQFDVTGVDISGEQVRRARSNVTGATFVHGDVMTVEFEPAAFDGVVMLYTLFHLPAAEQPELLERIAGWLVPGGRLLASLGSGTGDYVEPFHGVDMAWSERPVEESLRWLNAAGFDVVEQTTIGHGYEKGGGESHPLVLATTRPSR